MRARDRPLQVTTETKTEWLYDFHSFFQRDIDIFTLTLHYNKYEITYAELKHCVQ